MDAQPGSVIVVGAGLSGWRTAKDLRRHGYTGPLTLLGDEDELPYDRPPLSKAVLTGEREPEAVRLTSDEEIAELGIDYRRGVRVASVTDGLVVTDDGQRLEAEVIVIATGSRANIPPFIADMPDVRPLRTMADARRIKDDFGRISSVLILGGGFIGAEVAGSARKRGIEATIVEAMPNILGPLGPEIAAAVEKIHHEQGVTVLTDAPVEIVDATPNDGATVVLADGRKLTADLVVVGFGARLNTEAAGDLATPQGIECDDHGRVVGHPGLYAVGDVAAWWDPRIGQHVRREHWQTAGDGAAIVALTILGQDASAYLSAPPYFWTDQPGVKVQLLGWPSLGDRQGWVEGEDIDPGTVYGWWKGDTLVAVALLGRPRLMVRYRKQLMEAEI
ncbi:MAG TPA: FAD-dependent oxidoreductase [Aeromicrobium sp.]|nr:FAD-dependent oxidoreductase [Aeromicrobium sp.]HKY56537.1 FAD-dependent oxidoreductase [Aeromicrobium sp.]